MHRERSQPKSRKNNGNGTTRLTSPGTLYVVSSPIGNLDDITIRALRVLKTVSLIASEDPAATQALLTRHHATATITSYGPWNRDDKVALLLNHLKKGHDIALISDCGTPVIYDPGCYLTREAHRKGIPVRSVPGPSALTAAIAISGCTGDAVLFEGHLPRPGHSLKTFLATLRDERRTLVFFVPPHSLKRALLAIAKVFPTRRITITQDLTKPQERTVHGTSTMLLKNVRRLQKGVELTVVIEGRSSRHRPRK